MTSAALCADIEVARGFPVRAAFEVPAGGRLAILGPNGAGKSTVLAALAGNARLARGRVELGGRVLDAPGVRAVPPRARRVTLLDQNPRLFPHLDLRQNIAFGPRARGVGAQRAAEIADGWLERFGLGGRAGDRPEKLSGGQAQRVAIARAFAAEPELILLDEPFAALDAAGAPDVRGILAAELRRTGTTSVLVSHDLADAWQWSDRCLVIEAGEIVADTSPAAIAEHPTHPFTAALAGFGIVRGVWTGSGLDVDGRMLEATPERTADPAAAPIAPGGSAFAVVDPRTVRVAAPGETGALPGTVVGVRVRAGVVTLSHSTGIIAEYGESGMPQVGAELWLRPAAVIARPVAAQPPAAHRGGTLGTHGADHDAAAGTEAHPRG